MVLNPGINRVSARGGLAGIGANNNCGGNGSPGRIRIDSTVLSGNVSAENGKLVTKSLKNLFFVSQLRCVLNLCTVNFLTNCISR